ncbi:hypothetical protein LG3211_2264 [Lysobacter gummosus]|nr:hypothetical protein LG3211_2264 [Lysobacter gummosus]
MHIVHGGLRIAHPRKRGLRRRATRRNDGERTPHRISPSGCPPQHSRRTSPDVRHGPVSGLASDAEASPRHLPARAQWSTSGVLAYRCGGSVGIGRSRPHRLPVSPCAPVWTGVQGTCGGRSVVLAALGGQAASRRAHCARSFRADASAGCGPASRHRRGCNGGGFTTRITKRCDDVHRGSNANIDGDACIAASNVRLAPVHRLSAAPDRHRHRRDHADADGSRDALSADFV